MFWTSKFLIIFRFQRFILGDANFFSLEYSYSIMASTDIDDMEAHLQRLSMYKKPDLDNVKEITSAEYYYDPQCHLSTHEQLINDHETLETFRGWIEENPQIIKVRYMLNQFPFSVYFVFCTSYFKSSE